VTGRLTIERIVLQSSEETKYNTWMHLFWNSLNDLALKGFPTALQTYHWAYVLSEASYICEHLFSKWNTPNQNWETGLRKRLTWDTLL
jgi:hypothetical protein